MSAVTLMVVGGVILFGATAVYGLVWAIRHGQLGNFSAGARSIFDEDEPVGEKTDTFPGHGKGSSAQADAPASPVDPPARPLGSEGSHE